MKRVRRMIKDKQDVAASNLVFNYVVSVNEPSRVAFGTSVSREVLPRKGTNYFTSTYTPLLLDSIAPNTYAVEATTSLYHCAINKVMSTRGTGGLCRYDCRFKYAHEFGPGPNAFNLRAFPARAVPNKKPFNSVVPRVMYTINKNPGPGTYKVDVPRDRRIRFLHCFGGRKIMDPAVDVKCVAINTDTCAVCKLKPTGDYWHRNNKEFLCRPCKVKQHGKSSQYIFWKLEQFRKIRDCSFMHKHEETSAAIVIMNPKKVHKLRTREAYASQYFPN